MGTCRILVMFLCLVLLGLLSAGLLSVASAQTAVEYGIIGSKPPPKSPSSDIGSTINKALERTPRETRSTTERYKKETRTQKKTGGKSGGPLIIEQRGNHYERIN